MLRPLTATPVMPQVAGATPTQRSRSTIGRSCRGRYACEPPTGTPALPRPPTTEDTPTKCGALRGLWSRLSCPIDPPNAACGQAVRHEGHGKAGAFGGREPDPDTGKNAGAEVVGRRRGGEVGRPQAAGTHRREGDLR